MYQKERNCIIPTVCLWGKPYHTYKMFMFYNLCIRKKETVLFLQYVYVLYLYIRKGETAAYLGYAEGLKFVFHKEGKCIMPMICLQSSLCIMCLFWAYSNWMIRGTVLLFVLEKWRKLYLIWCIYIVYYVTDISNYRRGGGRVFSTHYAV